MEVCLLHPSNLIPSKLRQRIIVVILMGLMFLGVEK